jgi:hypothetical protein
LWTLDKTLWEKKSMEKMIFEITKVLKRMRVIDLKVDVWHQIYNSGYDAL